MILVKTLKDSQYSRLDGLFNSDFDSDGPRPENSEILAAFDGSQLVGFVLVEDIKMIGQIWTRPDRRDASIEIVKPLLARLREKYEGKAVIGALASEKRFASLYRSLRLEKIPGEFYRRNF